MSQPSSSLRDLYTTPPEIWTFPNETNAGDALVDIARLDDKNQPHVPLNQVLLTGLLQYSTTAVAMPWEVGKLLLQIQAIPKGQYARPEPRTQPGESDEEDEEHELSDSSTELYFRDPDAHGAQSSTPNRRVKQPAPKRAAPKPESEDDVVMPIGPSDGVWGILKRIVRWRSEGWPSLWKGLMTACITDAMSTALQPIFHNFLFVFVPVASRGWPMLLIPVASHLITGLLLSPLDLVRTRLIAQSSSAAFRTYTGPTDALSQILRDEGGIRGVYFHPHLLIPAILDNTLRPFIALSLPILLGSRFGVESDTHPFAWCFVEFIAGCAGLLVTLPVETIRRRLQIQARGNAKSMKCCVHTNKTPYTGVLNALWRIASEEGSRSSIQTRRDRQAHAPWPLNTGLPQLYRGLGMGIGAGSIVLFLSIIASGAGGADSGWAEL